MLMKRIQAPTMAEALEKTRVECGEDALLVETKQTSKGYLIVAARAPSLEQTSVRQSTPSSDTPTQWTRGFAPIAERGISFGLSRRVLRSIQKAMVGTRVRLDQPGDPAVAAIASRILRALINTEALALPKFRITTLVGSTGVGKTTTLAKLVAHARLAGETAAIVTTDTYRIAAVDQLRAFAEMLGVPMTIALSARDLAVAVEEHADVDRIFVDTSGKSPFDREAIEASRARMALGKPACLLCLAAGTRRVDAMAAVRGFAPMGPDCVVLTKWDETRAPGEALCVAIEQGLPISHITTGQEVPSDIVVADPQALAQSAFQVDSQATETKP